jgi:CheY-like chemotaxis protein
MKGTRYMALVKKIMMVDDDEDLLALLKVKLEKSGRFSVVNTTKGSTAVQLALDTSPNLIILDIDMPDMSGGEVAEALSEDESTKDIPVIFLSSLIPKEEAGKGLQEIGGRRMVSKYVSGQQLLSILEDLVR